MARTYTKSSVRAGNASKAKDLNQEVAAVYGEFNGGLSGHNIPINSVTSTKFIDPVYSTGVISSADGSTNGIKTEMISQAYYFTEKAGTGTYNPDQTISPSSTSYSGTIPAAAKTWTLTGAGWNAGWTSIGTALDAGAFLQFDAKEGMLKGTAIVDTDLPQQYIAVTSSVATSDGVNWGRRIGVFVNDVLVADTDFCTTGGRYTLSIPFAIPIGSQPCSVDVRWMANTKEHQIDNAAMNATNAPNLARGAITFRVHTAQLSIRNQYR
jgi:hypothetical protein